MNSPTQGAWTCTHGVDGRDFCPECYAPGKQEPDYEAAWKGLAAWALRERELVASNPAQLLVINAVIHRMGRAERGDPGAFETI